MAQQFPEAKVHGLDLVANFPSAIMPRNCHFHVGNVLDPLRWEDSTIDYVFIRIMYNAVPSVRWNDVIREVLRVLKPGGIVEIQDFDFNSKPR
jgi:ubiquinone/menaquinone biosynthesis C-methylase UbiE